ncbi:MAG: RNA polymerase sigma factor RpoE [Gammaproteobacteria bacterium]|nr:RNA polymerase sigma factor RpoE [Gammaproteobacteria bacterium]
MSKELQDQELVERVQHGSRGAFDLLVGRYQNRVAKLVARYVRDHSEVQDVTQEAFIKAYRALPDFRGESAFYTWLYRIAVNTAKNYLAANSRRPPRADVDAYETDTYESGLQMASRETPESLLLRDELASTIQGSMNELPEDLREALTLCEFEGLSYEEIAEVMDCPVGTVRSRIFRARRTIDRKIEPLLG